MAYCLKFPKHWCIYDIITVAWLELDYAPGSNPYGCPELDLPEAINADKDEWEVERLLNKQEIKHGRGKEICYLVRWKGYRKEHDQ